MNTNEAIHTIETASTPAALFPSLDDAKTLYRRLAKACHPDRNHGNGLQERARVAFAKLSDYYARRTGSPSTNRIGEWTVVGGVARGGLCDIHEVARGDSPAILKVSRRPQDNSLLSQEHATLKALQNKLTDSFQRYIPCPLGAMNVGGRRANIISKAEDCLTLDHITAQFTSRLDFRHIVWMGNRLLEILGAVHRQGVIHGAVLPHHLMYRPADHGLVLVDWTCSATINSNKIPLIVKRWQVHYPPEVRLGCPSPSTDLYMAAKALRCAARGKAPRPFRAILEWMEAESPAARPDDAWAVQDRWRKAAEEEYGKPRFVELTLPNN